MCACALDERKVILILYSFLCILFRSRKNIWHSFAMIVYSFRENKEKRTHKVRNLVENNNFLKRLFIKTMLYLNWPLCRFRLWFHFYGFVNNSIGAGCLIFFSLHICFSIVLYFWSTSYVSDAYAAEYSWIEAGAVLSHAPTKNQSTFAYSGQKASNKIESAPK